MCNTSGMIRISVWRITTLVVSIFRFSSSQFSHFPTQCSSFSILVSHTFRPIALYQKAGHSDVCVWVPLPTEYRLTPCSASIGKDLLINIIGTWDAKKIKFVRTISTTTSCRQRITGTVCTLSWPGIQKWSKLYHLRLRLHFLEPKIRSSSQQFLVVCVCTLQFRFILQVQVLYGILQEFKTSNSHFVQVSKSIDGETGSLC